MSSTPAEPTDLLDLKLMPAWLKEPVETGRYDKYEGDDGGQTGHRDRNDRGREGGRNRRSAGRPGERRGPKDRPPPRGDRRPRSGGDRPRGDRPEARREGGPRPFDDQQKALSALATRVSVRFVPHPPVFENVVTQVKSGPVAYSVFFLSRLFLEKAERYDVHLTAKPEQPLFQLGENGPVSSDQPFLETNAFRLAQDDFYKVEVTQSEPIKGNFTSVARCRTSGTLLGPTNHHQYQPRLRGLYEQRFSRRMSFPEYQRQIEILSDPGAVEQWKEEARRITTFVTLKEETPVTFNSAAEAERHFRQNHLPALVRKVEEHVLGGVASRQLADRLLRRLVEDAWSRETRSPSQMMQELAQGFRDAGLHIFRHRRGMLFVTSVRVRAFPHDQTGVSPQVQAILQTLSSTPGINRKDFADKILLEVPAEEKEARKLALASDLRWLVSEGYVIEFNDGSLDLPRVKIKATEEKVPDSVEPAGAKEEAAPPANNETEVVSSPESRPTEEEEIGGS